MQITTTRTDGTVIQGFNKIGPIVYKQPIPILRGESLENLKQSVVRLFDKNRVGYPYKNCLNCLNWNAGAELCKLANQRPPADIIVYSCPSHEDHDDIPF